MLLTCQAIYGEGRGEELAAFVERATGEPCPCRQGGTCPLLPSDEVLPTTPVAPRPRREWQHGLEVLAATAAAVLMGYGAAVMEAASHVVA